MATGERSVSEILQDAVRNVQEIIRSEVRLAKSEFREEASKAKSSAIMLGAGGISALFAAFFLLLTAVYALSLVMASWAATLIVGATMAILAALLLTAGLKRFKQIHPTPERTVETIKENVEWAKHQTK
jgi:uncharacterized membrane protein YqjE